MVNIYFSARKLKTGSCKRRSQIVGKARRDQKSVVRIGVFPLTLPYFSGDTLSEWVNKD